MDKVPAAAVSKPGADRTSSSALPGKPAKRTISAYLPILAILVFYLVNALVVSVAGDFPVNDDWIYGQAVKSLVETGQWDLGCSVASCFFQVILGWVVCKIFGFSYVALRVLDIAVCLVGTLALYGALRELALRRLPATIFALVYAANPLIVNLAYSFMTDVTTLSLTNLYFYFLVRGVKRDSKISFVYGSLALIAAISVRQTSAIFVACGCILLLMYWLRRRHSWTVSVFLIALPVLSVPVFQFLLTLASKYTMGTQWYAHSVAAVVHNFLRAPVRELFIVSVTSGQIACYFGLFCAPIVVGFCFCLSDLFKHRVRILPIWFMLAGNMIGSAISKLMIVDKFMMPFNQNTLHIPTLGPSTVIGANWPHMMDKARFWLTNVSGFLGFIFLTMLGAGFQRAAVLGIRAGLGGWKSASTALDRRWKQASVALVVFMAMAVSGSFVLLETLITDLDRYYLLAFAPALISLALCWRWFRVKVNPAIPLALLAVIAIYSTLAQQDYMSWNRARWNILTAYEKAGVPATDIDGGAEYDFDRNSVLNWCLVTTPQGHYYKSVGAPPASTMRWWPIVGEKYILSFRPIADYEVVERIKYWSALTFGNKEMLLLKQAKAVPPHKCDCVPPPHYKKF